MSDMTTADLLEPVLTDLAAVLAGAPFTKETSPTPCADFDVQALRDHIARGLVSFGAGFAAEDGQCPDPDSLRISSREAEVRAAKDQIVGALRQDPEAPLTMTSDPMPREAAAQLILGEYLVHGWDLATATGQTWEPSQDAIAASSQFFAGMLKPEYRGPGKRFGLEVDAPEGSGPLDRLIAQTGRDPGWSAPDAAV